MGRDNAAIKPLTEGEVVSAEYLPESVGIEVSGEEYDSMFKMDKQVDKAPDEYKCLREQEDALIRALLANTECNAIPDSLLSSD